MPCGINAIPVESEKNIKLVLKKLDSPVRKKPKPPKLTALAQKMLLRLLEPSKYEVSVELFSI